MLARAVLQSAEGYYGRGNNNDLEGIEGNENRDRDTKLQNDYSRTGQ